MKRSSTLALLLVGILSFSGGMAQDQGGSPIMDPDAKQILKKMTDYLGSQKRFSMHTENMLEEVYGDGQKIQYHFSSSVVIQRPNKVRAERTGFGQKQLITYDGETLAIYNPVTNHWAATAAPDNIDGLLHFARDTLDIVPPTGDFIFTNSFDLLTAGVTSGTFVGKAIIDGIVCHHLAFTSPLVDWQVWIADGGKPLPVRYVLTTKDDPVHPQYTVRISDWSTRPIVNGEMFKFAPPEGSVGIEFLRADTDN